MKTKCSSSNFFRSDLARPSNCIALLTDFGLEDTYVGVMKGVIARINSRALIIDLCHQVAPQNVRAAAFLLAASFHYFPPGTIHVAVVDPAVGSKRRAICVVAGDYFFVGPDNGILSIASSRAGCPAVYSIENEQYFLERPGRTFHGRDIFAPAAAHLANGTAPSRMGRKLRRMKQISFPRPSVEPGRSIVGRILYVDRFGNLISNIDPDTLSMAFPRKRSEALVVTFGGEKISGLSETFSDAAPAMALALFGSYNLLEIAVRDGSAAQRFNAGEGADIRVETAGRSRGRRVGR